MQINYYVISNIIVLFVFLCPQEQPGLHAHEIVTYKGEQVHSGSEQLPFWQRAWDHQFLLQPQAAHQGCRTHVPPLPCSHQDTIVSPVGMAPCSSHWITLCSCPSGCSPVGSRRDEPKLLILTHLTGRLIPDMFWRPPAYYFIKTDSVLQKSLLFYFIYDITFMTSQTIWWTLILELTILST